MFFRVGVSAIIAVMFAFGVAFIATAQDSVVNAASKLEDWSEYPDALFNPAAEGYDEAALASLKSELKALPETSPVQDAVILLIDVATAPVCCDEGGLENKALDFWNNYSTAEETEATARQFRAILRAHWRMMSGRPDLTGMMGEEAPSDYELMLFAPVGDLAPAKLPESACHADEVTAFSCKDSGSSRTYSLCITEDGADRPAQFRSIEEGAAASGIYPDTPKPIADAFFQAIWNGDEKFGFNNDADVQFIGPDTEVSADNASGFILKGGWDPQPWFSCKITTNNLTTALESVPFQGDE